MPRFSRINGIVSEDLNKTSIVTDSLSFVRPEYTSRNLAGQNVFFSYCINVV